MDNEGIPVLITWAILGVGDACISVAVGVGVIVSVMVAVGVNVKLGVIVSVGLGPSVGDGVYVGGISGSNVSARMWVTVNDTA